MVVKPAVNDWENPRVFQRNRLSPRAYFFPDTSLSLNGSWDFNYASSPLVAPSPTTSDAAAAAAAATTTPEYEWKPIAVPGHWQLQGYGNPHYTNTIFPFPCCPPHVPSENPTGTYRKSFYVPEEWDPSAQLRLRFDGVDSAYYVWVNGVEVGYAQGSRNPAEFDISQVTKRGAMNEVFVRVFQWSDGSYIEDQDQWWLSGIYRDVTLIAFPSTARIEDFHVKTDLDSKYIDAELQVSVDVMATVASTLTVTLLDPWNKHTPITSKAVTLENQPKRATSKFNLAVSSPRKWTAETPDLYDLEITLQTTADKKEVQKITHRVGFRKVEMLNGNICVNGTPLLFRGVNRHDHHPLFGRAVPLSFLRDDLLLMKRHNVNALRCCHYPSHPRLYELCDELGLWVMDEADLECHGFYDAVARPLDIPESMDYEHRKKLTFGEAAKFTSDNPEWKDAYVDRAIQMVQRDKNHTCIIIWSLGNEAFYGRNHQAMSDYIKSFDAERPIHYEGDVEAHSADMFSYMYPSVERITRLANAEGDTFQKPIVLCEYGHAMGNAPGALEEYMEAFRAHRRLQGGWIWEWANHGLWDEEKGHYGYGGDFNDFPNDGNFVMDGLCFSDHSPTPGLTELRKAYAPVHAWYADGSIHIENRHDFVTLDGLQAVYKIEFFGEETKHLTSGSLEIPNIQPKQAGQIKFPIDMKFPTPGETWLTVTFSTQHSTAWADSNYEIAWFQHGLDKPQTATTIASTTPQFPLQVQSTPSLQTITGPNCILSFSRITGALTSWTTSNNHPILSPASESPLSASLTPGFWRPPTDNDMPHDLGEWRRFGLDTLTSQLRKMTVSHPSPTTVEITTETFLTPAILDWGFAITTTYLVTGDGALTITTHLKPQGRMPKDLPRVGLDLRLVSALDTAKWFGLGPGEAYPDKKRSQKLGIYKASTAELHTPYEVPQEGGNRMETRWLRLGDGRGWGVKVTRENLEGEKERAGLFHWLASRYTAQDIEAAGHANELVERDAVFVRLDVECCGVGTGACGPTTLEKYRVPCVEREFRFKLEPYFGDDL